MMADVFDQYFGCCGTHVVSRVINAAQGWFDEIAHCFIVESQYGDILGDSQSVSFMICIISIAV